MLSPLLLVSLFIIMHLLNKHLPREIPKNALKKRNVRRGGEIVCHIIIVIGKSCGKVVGNYK